MNRPARRAGNLMIAIGVLLLLLSFGSTLYALVRPEWVDAQLAGQQELVQGNPLLERPGLTWMIAAFGVLGVIESGLSIALGIYTRRGVRWAIVTSLILTGLRIVIVGMLLVVVLLAAAMTRMIDAANGTQTETASLMPSLAISLSSTVVLGVLAVWLIQALRAESHSHAHINTNQGR